MVDSEAEEEPVERSTSSASRRGAQLQRVIEARQHDPFALLGRHRQDGRHGVTAILPGPPGCAW